MKRNKIYLQHIYEAILDMEGFLQGMEISG